MRRTDRAVISIAIGALAVAFGVLKVRYVDASSNLTAPLHSWLDADGTHLPFQSDEEILSFLRTAQPTELKLIGSGVGGAQKVRLEKSGVAAHACFRTIREDYAKALMEDGTYRYNFRDDALFEVAAYELNRMLGLDNIPPTVVRTIDGKRGSLQIWVEKAMTEKKRMANDVQPPSGLRLLRQIQNMRVFDSLIYNVDRNKGNILIDRHWKLWMIDHTRSFRRHRQLYQPQQITMIERGFWERLQALDDALVQQRLSPYLKVQEIRGLLKRRVHLVDHIQKLIGEKGENRVLFSTPVPAIRGGT